MLDWSNLQHFLAFATTDSLPKAAEKLGVNRTTVSRRIADLEKAFGATLVERRGRNLVLTQSGRDVLAVAEGIDGQLQGMGCPSDRYTEVARIKRTASDGEPRLLFVEHDGVRTAQPILIRNKNRNHYQRAENVYRH